jgi:D-tyrosyl-tRNA(Tyr) deacylase
MTDLAAKGTYDLGHMASVHDIEAAGAKAVDMALAATPDAAHAVFQTRASEREAHEPLRERARSLGLAILDPA